MNPRTPQVELPPVAETRADAALTRRGNPARKPGPSPATEATESPRTGDLRACDETGAEPFLFDDPYWDDAFDSYHNPTLRTCCRF